MRQLSSSLDRHETDLVLCYYVNPTSRIQIARIQNIENWYFERVIFPGERLLFKAPLEAQLEISTSETVSAVLSDKILCQRLQVKKTLRPVEAEF